MDNKLEKERQKRIQFLLTTRQNPVQANQKKTHTKAQEQAPLVMQQTGQQPVFIPYFVPYYYQNKAPQNKVVCRPCPMLPCQQQRDATTTEQKK